jgi:hypothetical protein
MSWNGSPSEAAIDGERDVMAIAVRCMYVRSIGTPYPSSWNRSLCQTTQRIVSEVPRHSFTDRGNPERPEDSDDLTLAERLLGKEATDRFVSRVARNLQDRTHDPVGLEQVRVEPGGALERAVRDAGLRRGPGPESRTITVTP